MDFRKHWDTWGWLLPACVIAVLFLRLVFGRNAFCGAEEQEHCLREWISALGGWIAVAAAVPTIYFLSKQITDANRNHDKNMDFQLQPMLILARRASQEAKTAVKILARFEKLLTDREAHGPLDRFFVTRMVENIDDLFATETFKAFGRNIAPLNESAVSASVGASKAAIDVAFVMPEYEKRPITTEETVELKTEIKELFDIGRIYSKLCIRHADRFLDTGQTQPQ